MADPGMTGERVLLTVTSYSDKPMTIQVDESDPVTSADAAFNSARMVAANVAFALRGAADGIDVPDDLAGQVFAPDSLEEFHSRSSVVDLGNGSQAFKIATGSQVSFGTPMMALTLHAALDVLSAAYVVRARYISNPELKETP